MRLPFFTLFVTNLVLFFLYPTLALAIHPQALARREHKYVPPPHVLSSRQHRVVRDLLDVCINLKVDLLADASQLLGLGSLLGPLDAGSKIQLCLCLKDLDVYLQTNDEVQALIGLLGRNTISTFITALINASPQAQKCAFPPNAHHTCNDAEPCHFNCDSHYVRQGNSCGCSSAVPATLMARNGALTTFAQAKASCNSQQTVCGIPGFEDTLAFECIDTTAKKDSCGGCMAPHPFFEADPVRRSSGIDCSTIPRAKSTSCSQSRCVVHACKDGWIPSPQADECIPLATRNSAMRQMQKRSSPLSADATAEATISSDLLTQITAIVNIVIKLPPLASAPSSYPAISNTASAKSLSEIAGLIDEITQYTGNLLESTTVSSLVGSADALLNTCGLLDSFLANCGCVQSLGISELEQESNRLFAAAASMQNWCSNNPIVPGSPTSVGDGHQPPSSPSKPNLPEQPVVVGLSNLLPGLGLSLKSNSYNITSINPNVTVNLDLLAQIVSLIDLVLNLQGSSDFLPPLPASSSGSDLPSTSRNAHPVPTASSHPAHSPSGAQSINFSPIIQATLDILQAPTVSSLVSAVDCLVNVSSLVKGALGQCDCVDALELQPLVTQMDAIVNSALAMQSWCQNHPVGIPQPLTGLASVPHSTLATTNSNDDSIIVGLSDLLTGAALGLLGPVKAGATAQGLDSGLSGNVDGLLTGLGIGPLNLKRGDGSPLSVDANATTIVNSDLLTQIEDLVGLVVQLERSCILPSLSGGPTSTPHPKGSVDPALVANIVQATGDLLQSQTVNSLVTSTDQVIDASTALTNAFAGCGCVEYFGDTIGYLTLIAEAALELKNWFAANPIVIDSESPLDSTIYHGLPGSSTTGIPPSLLSTDSGSTPIILGLNHLLSGLNLGGIKGVSTVDGVGNGLNSVVNTLDGLRIGPHGVRRRQPTKRQDSNQVDTQLKAKVAALIDFTLALSDAGSSLPSPTTPSPSSTASISLPSTPAPSQTPPTIDTNLVISVTHATGALLSCKSVDQLFTAVDALVVASNRSLEAVQGCGCVQEMGLDQVERYLIAIVSVAVDIQAWVRGHYVRSPSVKPASAAAPRGAVNVSDMPLLLPGLQRLVDGILDLDVFTEDGDSVLQGGLVSVVEDLLSSSTLSDPGMMGSSAAWKRRS